METLKNDIFKKLMSKAVCDTQDSVNEVIFIAKYNKWGVEFYTDENDVFGYVNLGFNGSDGFVDYEPTKEQLKEMELHIDNHIKEIVLKQKEEDLEDRSDQKEFDRMRSNWGY